jgi:trigger factor
MQVSVQSGEGLERRMTVELPAEEINQEVESRLKNIAKTARIDGFRPGKVPMKFLRTRYGLQVQQEVFGEMIQSSFGMAAAQEKLRPAGVPNIEPDIEQGQGDGRFAYTAVFEVLPEVQLQSLEGKSLQKPQAQIGDDDVDEMLTRLRQQRQTWEEVDRAAQNDDQLTISFEGFIDDEAFEGGKADSVPLVLGSGSMIEGFESGLLGAAAGDSRTLQVTFPDDYRVENLAGKAARFEVQVDKVSAPLLPEIDEEFAKSFGVESGDVEKFRSEIRQNMERELKQRIQSKVKSQALDLLLEVNQIDVPAALVSDEVDALRDQMRQNMGGAGKMELPRQLFEEEAKKRVALGLLIAEVIKANEIKLDSDRVQEMIKDMAASYEDPQEVVDFYNSNKQQRASVENVVLEDQAVDWIVAQVTVEETPSTFEEITGGAR